MCNLLSLAVPSSVALALGALTLWHAALITRGETSIERHINKKERQRLQKKGKVSTARGAGGTARAEPDVMCVSPACRSSGTPTVMVAGITGRCSWVWTCQGKAPGKPLPGKVAAQQRVGVLGHWGSLGWLGQSRTASVLCSVLLRALQGMEDPGISCLVAPQPCLVASSGLPGSPLPREPWLRSSAIVAAQGHGLTALARLRRAEKSETSAFCCVLLLSPQALAHPRPAALSSPAPWDGPELGPASLRDRAAHAAPGHLRPGCCRRPSSQAGERTRDLLRHCGSLWPECLAEGGCWYTPLTGARATGNRLDSVGAWTPALSAPWGLQAAPGERRQSCRSPL